MASTATFVSVRRLAVILASALTLVVVTAPVAHSDTAQAAAAPSKMMTVTPVRVIDTRTGNGGQTGKIGYNQTRRWKLNHMPANATAVTLNLTVTETEGGGYLTAWDCDGKLPDVSNLNYGINDTKANQVTIPLNPTTSEICVFSYWPTHLVADVQAWYGTSSDFSLSLTPIPPNRVFDSRKSGGMFAAGETRRINLNQVVPANAQAVTFNLTTADAQRPTFATVWPCTGTSVPELSNLNTNQYQIRPNQATVQLSATHEICVYSIFPQNLIIDVTGSWAPGQASGITTTVPNRVFDTRKTGNPLRAGETRQIYPQQDHIVLGQWTITESDGHGYQALFPCNTGFQDTSTINYVPNDTTSVAVYMDASKGGICVRAVTGGSHILMDVFATAGVNSTTSSTTTNPVTTNPVTTTPVTTNPVTTTPVTTTPVTTTPVTTTPVTTTPVTTTPTPINWVVPKPPNGNDAIPFRRNIDPNLVKLFVQAVGKSRIEAVAAQIDDLSIVFGRPDPNYDGTTEISSANCENGLCEVRVTVYIASGTESDLNLLAHEWAHVADAAVLTRHGDFGVDGAECAADRVASVWRGTTVTSHGGPCDSARARAILAAYP